MLLDIKTPLGVNDVAWIRLVTGEELVGRIAVWNTTTDKDLTTGVMRTRMTSLIVTKPVLLQVQRNENNQAGLGFGPFAFGVEEDSRFEIMREHMLVAPMKPRDDIASNYLRATTDLDLGPGLIK